MNKRIYNILGALLVSGLFMHVSARECAFISFKSVDLYKLELNTEHNVVQEINGKEHNVLTEVSSVLKLSLVEKNDEIQKLKVEYEKMDIFIESEYFVIEMKTSKRRDNEDIMDCIVKNIINKPFYLEMHSDGNIEVSGIEKICTRALDSTNYLDEKTKLELGNTLKEVVGKKTLENHLEVITHVLPNKKIEVGDKWSKSVGMAKSDIENKYSLEEINDSIFTILLKAEINNVNDDNESPISVILSGVQSGEIKIDEKTGWIVEGEINKKMAGSVKIDKCKEFPKGFEYPVKYTTNISYRTVSSTILD